MSRKLDLSAIDFHALSQAERTEFYRAVMQQARKERANAMRAMFGALMQRLRVASWRRRTLEIILPARLLRA